MMSLALNNWALLYTKSFFYVSVCEVAEICAILVYM